MRSAILSAAFAASLAASLTHRAETDPAATIPHDLHHPHPLPSAEANEVRRLTLQTDGTVWVATRAGVFFLPPRQSAWQPVDSSQRLAPAFAVAVAPNGDVWVGAWNGLHRIRGRHATAFEGIRSPVSALDVAPDGTLLAGGPDGYHWLSSNTVIRAPAAPSRYLNQIRAAPSGPWWLATDMGGFVWTPGSPGAYLAIDRDRQSAAVRGIAFTHDDQAWTATLGGLQRFQHGRLIDVVSPADGLPSSDVRCVALAPDGALWIGSAAGVARLESQRWHVRNGRRWLLDDDVRDLTIDHHGTAWIATSAGVSAIGRTNITLADKARHFHSILEARHVRPPGIVEKCRLRDPGDLATWAPEDDDNDGGYTAVAMAMESFRYAVTREPAALTAARRALSACEFLLNVTGPRGFLARSVIPSDWKTMHDPNEAIPDPEWAARRVEDPRNKRVPVRWRPSADGRWLWKGDTSSDEITAHFFGYFVMHQLTTDDTDRRRLRDQITRITDHLIANGLVLRDLDGQPTRWGIWAPEFLNDHPDWAMERGINSVEILSFLKLAHHVSGDARYEDQYLRLLHQHHYGLNVLEAPNLNPAWRTYIDMELLAFAYPALLALETDPALRDLYLRSFERWHETVRHDGNPLFEFLYAAYGDPQHANLDGARAFLRDAPLDLVRWDVDLSSREDLILQRSPEVERWQTHRLCPPSEIGYSRTDQNPWLARQGDGGRSESDGVFWLLPYWMGRFHSLLDATPARSPAPSVHR